MKRSEARELAMKMLFQMEAQKNFTENAKNQYVEEFLPGSDQLDYFNELWIAYLANKDQIDEMIEQASVKWHIARMAKIDLAVLRLGCCEVKFTHNDSVPAQVAINEAVNLAKKYGSEESGKFVNGVLGKIAKENA